MEKKQELERLHGEVSHSGLSLAIAFEYSCALITFVLCQVLRLESEFEEQNRQLDEAMIAYRREAKARKKLYNEIQV